MLIKSLKKFKISKEKRLKKLLVQKPCKTKQNAPFDRTFKEIFSSPPHKSLVFMST